MTEMTPEKLSALMSVAVFGAGTDALTVSVRDDGTEALIPYASLLLELQGALARTEGLLDCWKFSGKWTGSCKRGDRCPACSSVETVNIALSSASRLLGGEK